MEAILETPQAANVLPLPKFIADFGDSLLASVHSENPPVYDGSANAKRDQIQIS